jgi:hypothetical protein
LALMIIILAAASKTEPLHSVVKPQNFYDLGNLLMAFTMLYAYVNFSQFLIIWAGNIAEETPYYVFRGMGPEGATYGNGWQYVGLSLVILHFFVPFGMLLHRRTKHTVSRLVKVACLILVMRIFDLIWAIVPSFSQRNLHGGHAADHPTDVFHTLTWMHIVLPIGLAGIWIALFIAQLKRRPMVPLHDARLLEVAHGGH